ncbi:MAG: hypothetical protein ACRELA_24785 [Candidatus Rokuibacteriota bacterium]
MSGSSRPTSGAEPLSSGLPSARTARPAAARLAWLGDACGVGVALAALWLTVRSLEWPLVHDGPLMHYVAARLLEGAVPYRDLFDMNFPGVYLVHALGLVVFGGGDAGFRAFDLAVLGGSVIGLATVVASFGRSAAILAAALFWLYHVAGGPWRAGQRDLILCLPLVWMIVAGLAYARSGRPVVLGLSGLSLGVAVWIKPHAALLAPVLAALAWRTPRRWEALGALGLGVAAPAVAVLGWLSTVGGLAPFLDVVGGYLVPLYSRLGRESFFTMLALDVGVSVLVGLALWMVGGFAALWATGRLDARVALLAAGAVYGLLHFIAQGKGWGYHSYPLALFAVALGAAGLGAAVAAGRRLASLGLVVALIWTSASLAARGARRLDPPPIDRAYARAHAVAAALRPVVREGGTVQVLDTNAGGIHALYLLGARQPTRFLYDFHFYHDTDRRYVRRLRDELLWALRGAPPAAVVVFERGWPRGDYARLASFPALEAWLDAGYRLTEEGDGYRIFARRPATRPRSLLGGSPRGLLR